MNFDTIKERYEQNVENYPEEDRQQMASTGNPYFQPMIMPSEKADLYDKIRPEDVIETIRYLLMGYEFDKLKQEWVVNLNYGQVAFSKVGAWQITNLLFPVSNKSVSISKLTDSEIRARTKSLVRTAMKLCLRNWEEYGIRSPEQFFFVKEVVLSIAFITLKQPENAGVRTFIQGVTQDVTNRVVQETTKGKGIIGSVFRR